MIKMDAKENKEKEVTKMDAISARRNRINRLKKIIASRESWSMNDIIATFCMSSGVTPRKALEYIRVLNDWGFVKVDNSGVSIKDKDEVTRDDVVNRIEQELKKHE